MGGALFLIEDDEICAYLVQCLFQREGHEVIRAADGREAQELIDTMAPPPLAILDIMLPYVDGTQLLGQIRARPEWRDTAILMLTSMAREQDIAAALDMGADDYLVKPFSPTELTARVRRLLRKNTT